MKSVEHVKLLLTSLIFVTILSVGGGVSVEAHAQAAPKTITLDTVVKGEITDAAFEVPFKFSGKKGDLLVIQVAPDYKAEKSLYSTEFRLSRDKKALIDSSKFGDRVAAIELTKDGNYDLVVSRENGKNGKAEDIGGFALLVSKVDMLENDEPAEGQLTTDGLGSQFFAMQPDAPFVVDYKVNSDTSKYVTLGLYSLEQSGELKSIANTYGQLLTSAMGLDPVGDTIYFMRVSSLEDSLTYSLTLGEITK